MILVAGSANLDFVVRAHHIPAPGETVLGQGFQTFPGGKGANQAVACARAGGASTHMLAAFGKDSYAAPIEQSLQAAGVQLHAIYTPEHATGIGFICVSEGGENAITVAPGANGCLKPADLPALAGFSHLLLQLETPLATVLAYAQAAQAAGVKVVLNAAPAREIPDALLAALDVLVVNEGELATLAKHTGSVAECLARFKVPSVVVTLGHRGCLALHEGQAFLQTSYRIEVVDTTAAGDTFCGGLVAALSRGQGMQEALAYASAAAALACTRMGAQTSIPSAAEVEALMASQATQQADALQALRSFCGML